MAICKLGAISKPGNRPLQRCAIRKDGWTKPRRAVFLDMLAATCNVTESARSAGKSPESARRLRARDGEFALMWAEAMEQGQARLEEELIAHALGQGASGDNPDWVRQEPAGLPAFNPDLAIKILQLQAGASGDRRRRRVAAAPSQAEVDAALMKRLEEAAARPAKS